MKTQSHRIKENASDSNVLVIVAFIFSFTPIGLIFYFVAKNSIKKDTPLLKAALIISIISLIGWILGFVLWGVSYWFWGSFLWGWPVI